MGRGARKPAGFRDVDGILLLDKPVGISSNGALQNVRHLFQANKAGHTGSLDPLATGMLPICFGEATKFSSYLLDASKSYRALCQLGKTTTTGDAEGEVVAESAVETDADKIREVLERFCGKIEQVPPMYSALKQKGQRLYHIARSGREVERAPRSIEIFELRLLRYEHDLLEIFVHCSKGSYIRTLAEDIGKALGCGAFIQQLERIAVQPYWHQPRLSMEHLQNLATRGLDQLDQCLLPVNSALADLPELIIGLDTANFLQQGQVVQLPFQAHLGLVSLVTESGQFIGVGEGLADCRIAPKRLMNTGT